MAFLNCRAALKARFALPSDASEERSVMRAQKLIAKVLTVLLFGVLILSFAIWGIGDMFRTGGGP